MHLCAENLTTLFLKLAGNYLMVWGQFPDATLFTLSFPRFQIFLRFSSLIQWILFIFIEKKNLIWISILQQRKKKSFSAKKKLTENDNDMRTAVCFFFSSFCLFLIRWYYYYSSVSLIFVFRIRTASLTVHTQTIRAHIYIYDRQCNNNTTQS